MEKAKVFIKMGEKVGIKAERRSQRGIIAKRFMPKLEKYETAEFVKACPRVKFRTIKINDGSEVYYL